MNATSVPQFPHQLIQLLFEADGNAANAATVAALQLSADQCDLALRWLRRILVDFEALDQHIALLQELYDAPFRYSRPRSNRLNVDDPVEPPQPFKFRHCQRLPDEQITTILNDGVNWLRTKDDVLKQLLLNPVALYDLFDVIDDLQPDRWLEEMNDVAAAILPSSPTVQKSEAHPAALASLTTESPLDLPPGSSREFWERLQQSVTTALQQSDPKSAKANSTETEYRNESAMPTVSERVWRYVTPTAAVLACAASLVAVWIVARVNNNERTLQSELAMLTEAKNSRGNPTETSSHGLVLHSAIGRSLNLEQLLKEGFLSDQEMRENPKHTLSQLREYCSPELQALIDILREQKRSDLDVLIYLRSLIEKKRIGDAKE